MEIEITSDVEGSFQSSTVEAQASTTLQPIQLIFPSLKDRTLQRIRKLSMVVDRCLITYHPQCPINSTGRVRVFIYDNRLDALDQEQAQYVFPVGCGIDLYYHGNSYASLNDETCPWVAKYRLEGSNIRIGVGYCKMKALCTSKQPEKLPFRPPEFKIRSSLYNENDVDCSHVAHATRQPQLCRTMSTIESGGHTRPKLLPGLTYQQARSSISIPTGPLHSGPSERNDDDPGPSVSEVGSNTSNTIVLEPTELAQIVGNAVAEAIKTTS
ncbi:hypothetical protein RHSIM_Rhsim06G0068600 [Rhododendron simsii]|uniref:Uncharacterized protein n=1 Tax=Rhododendron simsii TaxID=118357 RepID=A0A834GWZ3_RHOSS|nr:hypothetical protein RHSIM_Rhsim06G0068600 [Rhododendron simsii]